MKTRLAKSLFRSKFSAQDPSTYAPILSLKNYAMWLIVVFMRIIYSIVIYEFIVDVSPFDRLSCTYSYAKLDLVFAVCRVKGNQLSPVYLFACLH